MTLRFEDLRVGEAIPELVSPPLDRVQIAMYAGASGDFNPIHIDDDQARRTGLPGIIAHGMLPMALLGRLLTGWVPQRAIRDYSVRFTAMAFPGDSITRRGVVKAKNEAGKRVELELTAVNQRGEPIIAGSAHIVLE